MGANVGYQPPSPHLLACASEQHYPDWFKTVWSSLSCYLNVKLCHSLLASAHKTRLPPATSLHTHNRMKHCFPDTPPSSSVVFCSSTIANMFRKVSSSSSSICNWPALILSALVVVFNVEFGASECKCQNMENPFTFFFFIYCCQGISWPTSGKTSLWVSAGVMDSWLWMEMEYFHEWIHWQHGSWLL